MDTHRKKYEKQRDAILNNKKLSDTQKETKRFNKWISYISNYAENISSIKYEHEKIRIRV